jgi:hypothetical protein
MNFDYEQMSAPSVADLLQEAAARTGFSAAEMEAVLESDLTIDELLNYITAVVSRRMN